MTVNKTTGGARLDVWSVANQKGGVGKTTTTVALGGLAAASGKRVLLVDLDPHGSLTCYFRFNPDALTQSVFTLFRERKQLSTNLVGQLIQATAQRGLALLPASTGLATLERQAIGADGLGLVMVRVLELVQEDFDLVIIDCPPQLGVLMVNALAACHKLLIPVQTEFLALQGLERILRTLQMMQRSRSRDLSYVIIPTMFDRRTQASVASLRALRNTYSQNIWPGVVPIDTKFRDASKAGLPPHIYAAESNGVIAYARLLHYLQVTPFSKSLNLQ